MHLEGFAKPGYKQDKISTGRNQEDELELRGNAHNKDIKNTSRNFFTGIARFL